MKLAFALDGLITDLPKQIIKWRDRLLIEGDPFTTRKLLNDEIFWATMPLFTDVVTVAEYCAENKLEYIILTERPKNLRYLTESWLRRNKFKPSCIIYSSVKRFDAKLNNVTHVFDTGFPDLEFYEFENIEPILVENNFYERVKECYLQLEE